MSRLIEAWKKLGEGRHSLSRWTPKNTEDAGTRALSRTPRDRPAFATPLIDIEDIGWRDDGSFVDLEDRVIELAIQTLSLGRDVSHAFGRPNLSKHRRVDRAAMEGHPFQQGHSSDAVGNGSGSPQTCCLLSSNDDPNAARIGASLARSPIYRAEGPKVALITRALRLWSKPGAIRRRGFYSPGVSRLSRILPANIGAGSG